MDVLAAARQIGPGRTDKARDPRGLDRDQRCAIEGAKLDIVEFGEGESKHIAASISRMRRRFSQPIWSTTHAHLYLQEQRLESWLARLDELKHSPGIA